MELLLEELGFKKYDDKVSLDEDMERTYIQQWDRMYTKIDMDATKPWGCTVYVRDDFPGIIRIDAAVAPNAVFGHLGMKKFQGLVEPKKEVLEVLLNQVLQGHYETDQNKVL